MPAGNSTMYVSPCPRGSFFIPHSLDGVASKSRLPDALGVALESIQKYAAGPNPS